MRQKHQLNIKEEPIYEMNIPPLERKAKDSYVTMHGQTSLLDPTKRNILNRKKTSEEFCEADQKFSSGESPIITNQREFLNNTFCSEIRRES